MKSAVKRIAGLLLILILLSIDAISQYYSTGQDPASLKWRQIKTERYRIIFPEEFTSKAQYLANIFDIVSQYETITLKSKVPSMPVILHTQSVISNGVTVWAPRRIELYPCSPQQSYSEDWLEQLALHEYRHAVQVSKMNQGFTHILNYLFGEQALGAILGLYVPTWFLEGDATVTETALSSTGRGRSALFESVLRSQILEKGIYRYDKATMGSYKTFTPDDYSLGYFLVGQARIKYGPDLWNSALDRPAKLPFMVVPFSSGIHRITSLTKTKLYKETMKSLDSSWRFQEKRLSYSACKWITKPDKRNYSVFTHPLFINDSTILADKSCLNDIDRFVLIDRKTGHEKILLTPGSHISGTTSISNELIAWSEMEPDPRWQNKDYAEIKVYNMKTSRIHDLTHETRYFAPVISPDGLAIVAVYISETNKCAIHLLSSSTGELLKEYPIAGDVTAITPNWSPDGRKIVFTWLDHRGETIAILDIATGSVKFILPFTFNEFSGPAYFFRHYIIYSVDFSGIENLYALDTLTSQQFQVTSARFASFDPDFSSDKMTLIYSDYCSDGLMIAESAVDTSKWIPCNRVNDQSIQLYKQLSDQEKVNIQDTLLHHRIYKMNLTDTFDLARDTIKGKIHSVKKYSKWAGLFHPHSWAPASFNLENLTFHPGISLLSQNLLSTMYAGAGYQWDINERTGKFILDLSYHGWYPQFDFHFDYGKRASSHYISKSGDRARFTWNETNLSATASIPWNFSHGKFYRSLQPFVGTTLIYIDHDRTTPANFASGLIQSMDYGISFSQTLRSNFKDMYPRWGQILNFRFRNTPFTGNSMGSILALEAGFYFPGILRHHGIWLYGGVQERDVHSGTIYRFANVVSYPRGYAEIYDQQLYSIKLNYKFPFLYPDLSVSSLFYFKRFKMNLFFDWAQGNNPGSTNIYQSTGAELTADLHILRFIYPFELGVRSLYFPDTGSFGFEFLYAIRY